MAKEVFFDIYSNLYHFDRIHIVVYILYLCNFLLNDHKPPLFDDT